MRKKAMKLAQLAINNLIASSHATDPQYWRDARQDAVTALAAIDKALAQPSLAEQPAQQEQEPVAWLYPEGLEALKDFKCWTAYPTRHDDCTIPLFTTPPQRTWVGLSEEDIESIFNNWPTYHLDHEDFARAIEAKLREKNS